jgi:hypothetical protein
MLVASNERRVARGVRGCRCMLVRGNLQGSTEREREGRASESQTGSLDKVQSWPKFGRPREGRDSGIGPCLAWVLRRRQATLALAAISSRVQFLRTAL